MGLLEPHVRHRGRDGQARLARSRDGARRAPRGSETKRAATTRAIVAHDLAQARAAFAAAAELGLPVTIVSAPGAALYQGVGYFASMIETARREFPDVEATAILDCGDASGLALAAFRHGIAAVRVTAPVRVRTKLADIARQSGARLIGDRIATLDLAGAREPRAACRDWLAQPTRRCKG